MACCAGERAHYYQVRLTIPVSSHSKPGTPFEGRIIGSLNATCPRHLPRGTVVYGHVTQAQSIGFGLRRERASLTLAFDRCRVPGQESQPCQANLVALDNARESVLPHNRVRGILAGSHPHNWLGGVWYRPLPTLFQKAPAGLTGAGGLIYSHLAPNPFAAAAIVASRLVFFRLPEPEIELAPGADLILGITAPESLYEPADASTQEAPLPPDLNEALARVPANVSHADRSRAADIINTAFAGTRQEVEQAFRAAGWSLAEPLTVKSFARTYKAFTAMSSYPDAPVSTLLHDGRAPEMVFQKSLNSLAKRHHIRLWPVELNGGAYWLGAATHDIAITFDWSRASVTHRIDPHIDRERSIVFNDLTEAGCIASSGLIPRHDQRRRHSQNAPIVTDGGLLAMRLQGCSAAAVAAPSPLRPRRSPLLLAARRVLLETRHYVTRGNAYYLGFQTLRWRFSGRKSNPAYDEYADSPLAPDPLPVAGAAP